GDAGVVVAAHGSGEEPALERALAAGAPYVGLVASVKRGNAVVGFLRDDGVAEDQLARIHTPAGLDIGAKTPQEIALAILAEVVQERRHSPGPVALPEPREAIDPVCGMTVSTAGRLWVEHQGL